MNTMYDFCKYSMESGTLDFTGPDFFAALVSPSYVPDFATDDVVSVITPYMIGGATLVTGITVDSTGSVSAGPVTFTGISAGLLVGSIVFFHNNGSYSILVGYYDTGTGLPFTTTGSAVTVNWNGSSSSGQLFTL